MSRKDRWFPGMPASRKAPQGDAGAIVVRDLPGVQAIEDKLLLNGNFETPEISAAANAVTEAIFGLDYGKARSGWFYDIDSLNMGDDEIVEMMLPLGLDMRGADGHPLRCTRLIAPQAEVAARKLGGKMPTKADVSVSTFEAGLRASVDAFLAKKGGG